MNRSQIPAKWWAKELERFGTRQIRKNWRPRCGRISGKNWAATAAMITSAVAAPTDITAANKEKEAGRCTATDTVTANAVAAAAVATATNAVTTTATGIVTSAISATMSSATHTVTVTTAVTDIAANMMVIATAAVTAASVATAAAGILPRIGFWAS